MTMHFWDAYWGARFSECPCDVHFVEWLRENEIRGATIYHFGSGGHHTVGIECARDGLGNAVFAVTASPSEYDDYVKLLIEHPEISKSYLCYFGDIYTVNVRLLPRLDVVTLFHLNEFRSEKNDSYGGLTDLEVGLELAKAVRPGGWMLFYSGSFAFEAAQPNIAELVTMELIEPAGTFKTLELYRRTDKLA